MNLSNTLFNNLTKMYKKIYVAILAPNELSLCQNSNFSNVSCFKLSNESNVL